MSIQAPSHPTKCPPPEIRATKNMVLIENNHRLNQKYHGLNQMRMHLVYTTLPAEGNFGYTTLHEGEKVRENRCPPLPSKTFQLVLIEAKTLLA